MDNITYPSAGFGQAIEIPIPPVGNSTGYGTNIPGTVVPSYSGLTPDTGSGFGFPTTLQQGLDWLNTQALNVEGGALGAVGSVISGQNPVTAAQQGATALNSVAGSSEFLANLTVSRIVTVIVGLIALFAGFSLLGQTSLTDAVRSLKPV